MVDKGKGQNSVKFQKQDANGGDEEVYESEKGLIGCIMKWNCPIICHLGHALYDQIVPVASLMPP